MAGGRHASAVPAPRSRRRVAWLVWLVAIAVLLGAYAVALRWVTLRVESGIEASIHPMVTEAPLTPPTR